MTKSDIEELLALKGWTRRRLARELELTEDAVYAWLCRDKQVKGPAAVLMRFWLDQARAATLPEPSSAV